jgi:thioredoxin-like negative regulator of GroEL
MSQNSRRQRLEEMLAETPDDAELRYMLAMEHVTEGDDAGAVRHFEEIMRAAPDYPHAYHQAGRALVRLGRIDEAKAVLAKGIPAARRQGNDHAAGEMTELLMSL